MTGNSIEKAPPKTATQRSATTSSSPKWRPSRRRWTVPPKRRSKRKWSALRNKIERPPLNEDFSNNMIPSQSAKRRWTPSAPSPRRSPRKSEAGGMKPLDERHTAPPPCSAREPPRPKPRRPRGVEPPSKTDEARRLRRARARGAGRRPSPSRSPRHAAGVGRADAPGRDAARRTGPARGRPSS